MSPRKRIASNSLLWTKLHRPPLTADFVQRERLINALEKYPNRPLTLISAPAGYGKSTLAADWLERATRPSAWVSLDKGDNDLHSFLLYICRAVQGIFPESMKKLGAALDSPKMPAAEVVERYLINGLSEIEEPFILVIDDYQLIAEAVIHDLLTLLVSQDIPSLHIALLTRRDPPLPLHKFRGRGNVTEISLKDLMFTPEETRDFLLNATEVDIGDDNASVLDEKLEGWITGLRLISYSISDRESLDRILEGFSGRYGTQADYLVSEVLARQPADISEMLLVTSIVDRFNATLCDHICESADSCPEDVRPGESFISWLYQNNIFIISLDAEGYWFRYHHLFRQLLLKKLEETRSPAEIADLHKLASRWFLEQGLIDEAIKHALKGGDEDFAVEIVEANRLATMNNDLWYVLNGWLNLIPEDLKRRSPGLILAQTWIEFFKADLQNLLQNVSLLGEFAERGELSESMAGEVVFFDGYFQYYMAQGHESIASLTKALELLPESHDLIRSEAELHYCLAVQMVDGIDKALSVLADFHNRKREISTVHQTRLIVVESFSGLIDLDLVAGVRGAAKLHAVAGPEDLKYVVSWALYIEALSHFLWNESDEAKTLFHLAMELLDALHMMAALDIFAMQALSFMFEGQADMADQAMLAIAGICRADR